jgi:hypothetical protein
VPLWVAVNINGQADPVRIVVNRFAPKWAFKESTAALGGLIEGAAVGSKQVIEGAAGFAQLEDGLGDWSNLKDLLGLFAQQNCL